MTALAPCRELWSYSPVREIVAAASEEWQTFSERAARANDDPFARTSQAAAAGTYGWGIRPRIMGSPPLPVEVIRALAS